LSAGARNWLTCRAQDAGIAPGRLAAIDVGAALRVDPRGGETSGFLLRSGPEGAYRPGSMGDGSWSVTFDNVEVVRRGDLVVMWRGPGRPSRSKNKAA